MKRRHFILALSAALTACAGVRQPAPQQANVVAPSSWRQSTPAATTGLQAEWWNSFGDTTLNALIVEALSNSDDLALAAARVREARAELDSALAQRLPNVQAALGGGRERSVNPGFGVVEEQSAREGLIQASFDTDLFGRLKAASAASRASLLATEDAQQTVRLGVAATAASAYFTLLALDARLAVVHETLTVRRAELHIEQQRYDEGYSNALDLARAEAELATTEQLIPALEVEISRTENGLSIVLGRLPGEIVRGAPLAQHALPEVPVSLPSALLRSRPDLAAAEARLAATDHALDAARAAFLPDVRLSASGGFVGATLVKASPVAVWSLGGSVLAPLFDAGRLQAQQDAATARRDEAAFAYRKAALQAFREVEDNLSATAKYREQYEALSRQRDILARAFRLATERYREGYAAYLDQLDAQRNLLSSELSLVQARLNRFNATISLMQALGGGW
jgi:NodT family efflux transporter outer membrane factor (OMF) lipoprotein